MLIQLITKTNLTLSRSRLWLWLSLNPMASSIFLYQRRRWYVIYVSAATMVDGVDEQWIALNGYHYPSEDEAALHLARFQSHNPRCRWLLTIRTIVRYRRIARGVDELVPGLERVGPIDP